MDKAMEEILSLESPTDQERGPSLLQGGGHLCLQGPWMSHGVSRGSEVSLKQEGYPHGPWAASQAQGSLCRNLF